MPNWCHNHVTITAGEELIFLIKKAVAEGSLLHFMVPEPQHDESDDAQGMPAWYVWRSEHWGTKWEVGAEIIDASETHVTLQFDSAWAPPIAAYSSLFHSDENISIDAYYIEWGAAYCGNWIDGTDDYWDIPNASKDVVDRIPHYIDQFFCISETLADWEKKEAEYEGA